MSRSTRCVTIIALSLLPVAADAQARDRVWARLSVGRGDLQVSCNICRSADQSSWSADVSVGGWTGKRTKLGGELGLWRRGGNDATQRVMQLGAVSQIYPFQVPAFVKLGVGLLTYNASDGEESLDATSFAAQGGFGFDIRVPGSYIVVPHVMLVQGFNGGLYLDGTKVTGWSRVTLVRLGIGVGVGR